MEYSLESDRLIHKNGTKFYWIDFIKKSDQSALVVFQWGRVGAESKILCRIFKSGDLDSAFSCRDKKLKEKYSHLYHKEAWTLDDSGDKTELNKTFNTKSELIQFLPYWDKIDSDIQTFLSEEANENTVVSVDHSKVYDANPLYGRF